MVNQYIFRSKNPTQTYYLLGWKKSQPPQMFTTKKEKVVFLRIYHGLVNTNKMVVLSTNIPTSPLNGKGLALLAYANIPLRFGEDTFQIASYFINYLPI